jgi:hypothetical protein
MIGNAPFTPVYSITPSGSYGFPTVFNNAAFTDSVDYYASDGVTVVGKTYTGKFVAGQAGQFRFALTSVTDLYCTNDTAKDIDITVNELPDVDMTTSAVCESEGVEVTFTSTYTNPTFTLDYKVNNVQAPTIGLGNVFPYTALTQKDASTYTTNISAGQAGVFTFDLYEVSDGRCTRKY